MNTPLARRLYVVEQQKFAEILPLFCAPSALKAVWLGDKAPESCLPFYAFAQSKNLLGQEFDLIIYDCTISFHVESLAIASGTLTAGGLLLMLVDNWASWHTQIDQDSLRWNNRLISAVNFRHYFKQCYQQYFAHLPPLKLPLPQAPAEQAKLKPTAEQQAILNQILLQQADNYILTAPRGRGKSALAGFLANQLKGSVYLTSANKRAVNILQKFCQRSLHFIAPDSLWLKCHQQAGQFSQSWLIVDEAAMLPMHFLHKFASSFNHCLFSTTLHSYEGTGRGFELKFMQAIKGTAQGFRLRQPLRWGENDPLEQLVNQLLLFPSLDQNEPSQPPFKPPQDYSFAQLKAQAIKQELASLRPFYQLLTLAHYRTSPVDLRRLLDGEQQQFWQMASHSQLLAGLWGIEEGGMTDQELIAQIQRGIRRPKGNLVSQVLCFQQQLPEACQLKSLRISRIAVQPVRQQQGIGTALIQQLIEHYRSHATIDYLSVSFGYQARLAHFWQQCGFELVYLGEHQEATTGYYQAIALYPLSQAGNALCQQAKRYFYRNIGLQPQPLALCFAPLPLDWRLQAEDWLSLKNFAKYHRSFYATQPAIERLIQAYGLEYLSLLMNERKKYAHKPWLKLMRNAVANALSELS